MPEPTSSTTAVALAAGTITVTGTIIGVQYDALLAGFFGGLVSLSFLPPMSLFKTVGSVAGSALLAGFFAPIFAAAAHAYLPWLASVGDFARIAAAAALGIGWQALLPTILNSIRAWFAKKGGVK